LANKLAQRSNVLLRYAFFAAILVNETECGAVSLFGVRGNETLLRAVQPIRRSLAEFFGWWGYELWDLVPAQVRGRVSGPGPRIVVAVGPSGLRILDERGGQLRSMGAGSEASAPRGRETGALTELARSQPQTPIGIRLPFEACFARRVALPAAARKNFRSILGLDLERATPFRLDDVYTSHYLEDTTAEGGRLKVRQLVVKRTTLDPLIAEIESLGLRVSFADCWCENGRTALPVDFLEKNQNMANPFGSQLRPTGFLVALLLLLACSATFLVVRKHDGALDQLQQETARAKGEAQNVRRIVDRADAVLAEVTSLRRMKLESIPVAQILEELARILPDTAWLSDLRIEGDTVEISGLSTSAANLLPILERSTHFVDAALAAPLTLDPREDKERFSLRVRVRRQPPERASSREGRSG
jgi:general secretion pathway protein L